ncbi:MAG: ABC transporter ATP-binding protein [Crenarchaeota archaeon]|nr:ABC transporter ATP-binding protein [Thermoproteota archaeon]
MVEVRLENVTKKFGRVVALRDINLRFRDGKFTVVLGPSGSGKSTLLYLIAGIYKPTRGRIYFDDKDVTNLPPNKRNVGLVFQNYALYPHMTVYENIAFPLKLRKTPQRKIDEKVHEVAKLLHIEELLDRYPHQLSGGQQQRVALARALVKEPAVLLLDEPLSNLDALLRVKIRAELKKLQEQLGITAIYVTHDQAEAMALADEIIVIHRGVIQQKAPPKKIYEEPANLFVAGFIGNPPTNLLKARLVDGAIELGGSRITIPARLPRDGYIVVGFRPEHASVDAEPLENHASIPGEVYVVEDMGKEKILTIIIGGEMVKVIAPPTAEFKPGDKVYVNIPYRRIMLFDPETGARIEA